MSQLAVCELNWHHKGHYALRKGSELPLNYTHYNVAAPTPGAPTPGAVICQDVGEQVSMSLI